MLLDIDRIARYVHRECGVGGFYTDVVGWLIASHRALANQRHVTLPEADMDEYRYALDALIESADEMETQIENLFDTDLASIHAYHELMDRVDAARERAAELAGRLYEIYA